MTARRYVRALPKLLLVGHTYAALENRKKTAALARHFDLTCVTSLPPKTEILGQKASDFDNDSDAGARTYKLHRLPQSAASNTTFSYQGLRDIMAGERFDVVLVENEPWAVNCWQARFLKSWYQPSAIFGEFTWENVERPHLKGLILAQAYRLMCLSTDFVICGNQAAAALMQKRGMPSDATFVSPQLGVDLINHGAIGSSERATLRREHDLPEDAFIVGFCGRLTEEKGIPELIEACESLRDMGHKDVHVALLGAGVMKEALAKRAESLPWLHVLPPRPHFEIPRFLQCLDVFVLGSKPVRSTWEAWDEQFGHVLIEAMACGVVTMGSDSGAIPEVLGDNEAIFQWGNVAQLTSLLQQAKENPERMAALRQRQGQRVRDHFTHEAIAEDWAQFIKSRLAL